MRCHKTNASAPAIQMQRTTIMLHKVMIGIAVVVVRCFMPVTSSSRRRTPASRASLPPPKRKATDQQAGASIQRLHLVDLQELSRKRLVIAKAEWTQGEAFAPHRRLADRRLCLLRTRRDGEPLQGMSHRSVRRPHLDRPWRPTSLACDLPRWPSCWSTAWVVWSHLQHARLSSGLAFAIQSPKVPSGPFRFRWRQLGLHPHSRLLTDTFAGVPI